MRTDRQISSWIKRQQYRAQDGRLSNAQLAVLSELGLLKQRRRRTWDQWFALLAEQRREMVLQSQKQPRGIVAWLQRQLQRWLRNCSSLSYAQRHKLARLGYMPTTFSWQVVFERIRMDARSCEELSEAARNGDVAAVRNLKWIRRQVGRWSSLSDVQRDVLTKLNYLPVKQATPPVTWLNGRQVAQLLAHYIKCPRGFLTSGVKTSKSPLVPDGHFISRTQDGRQCLLEYFKPETVNNFIAQYDARITSTRARRVSVAAAARSTAATAKKIQGGRLISIRQAAARLHVSYSYIYSRARARKDGLKFVARHGNRLYLRRVAVDRLQRRT